MDTQQTVRLSTKHSTKLLKPGCFPGLSVFSQLSAPHLANLTSTARQRLNVSGLPGLLAALSFLAQVCAQNLPGLFPATHGVLPAPRLRTSMLNKGFHVTSPSADSGLRAILKEEEAGGR